MSGEINKNSNRTRVLVVDNNKADLELIDEFLKEETWEVKLLEDSSKAMEVLAEYLPDIVIFQVNILDTSPFEICKKIQTEDAFNSVSILFASAHDELIGKVFEVGGSDYVQRPIIKQDLISRIHKELKIKKFQTLVTEELQGERGLVEILSHDIANPLGSLYACIKRLDKELRKGKEEFDLEKSLTIVEKMLNGYKRITDLTSMVKDLHALILKKQKLSMETVDLSEVYKDVEEIFEERLLEKKISLKDNFSEAGNIKVTAERKSLTYTVINNLISNAIKFSQPDSSIEINVEAKDDIVEFRVKDTGVGMDKELQGKIFNKAAKTTRLGTGGEKGTGFGMPLVQEYMQIYGGDITVTSVCEEEDKENHGTTMILSFKKAA